MTLPYLNPEHNHYEGIPYEGIPLHCGVDASYHPCPTPVTSRMRSFRDGRGEHVDRWPMRVLSSTTAIIVHGSHWDEGEPWTVLVHQRSDNGWWGFPGGAIEVGESLKECLVREAQEETGLLINPVALTSIDSDPTLGALCQYPDGNVIQYVNHTFLCTIVSGIVRPSRESLQMRWVSTDTLPEPFLISHMWRLKNAFEWLDGQCVIVR